MTRLLRSTPIWIRITEAGGVLFSSNPHGQNEEGWNRGRYGLYHDLETWRRYVLGAGFIELEYYYRGAGITPRTAAVAG